MEISFQSKNWQEAIDITERIEELIKDKEGKACLIFCPHTTAGITINEGYDKAVMKDVLDIVDELVKVLNDQNPDLKPKDDFKEKHPNYRNFFVDPNPPLKLLLNLSLR